VPARAGLDRPAVVRAAAKLLDAAGRREVTLTELAAHLGVRTPSLYNHIAGQAELRRELALLGVQELFGSLARSAIGRSGDDAIRAIAHAYRAYALAHPGLYPISLRADPTDEALAEAGREGVAVIATVLDVYGLRDDDLIHVIRALRSMVHGFVSLEMAGGFAYPHDIDVSFDRLIGMFLSDLHHLPRRS
jgi:AcrR family transcriptional regulator